MIAALFPGQGFEQPDMARAWGAHPLVALASRASAVDVHRAVERFAPELFRTSVLQPALVAVALAAYEGARVAGVRVDAVAGHSVGEIAAWSASGALSPEAAVELAAARGAAMEREAMAHPGGMVAVRGESSPAYKRARELTEDGALELAARNGREAWVMSGALAAVAEIERCGGRRLHASGAWHSKAMNGARAPLARALAKIEPAPPARMLVSCLDGAALVSGSPDLVQQLTKPVQWYHVMSTLIAWGVTDIVTMGPGKTMRALVHDSPFKGRIWSTDTQRDIDALEGLAS